MLSRLLFALAVVLMFTTLALTVRFCLARSLTRVASVALVRAWTPPEALTDEDRAWVERQFALADYCPLGYVLLTDPDGTKRIVKPQKALTESPFFIPSLRATPNYNRLAAPITSVDTVITVVDPVSYAVPFRLWAEEEEMVVVRTTGTCWHVVRATLGLARAHPAGTPVHLRASLSGHTHDYVAQDDGTQVCDCQAVQWADGSDLAFSRPHARS